MAVIQPIVTAYRIPVFQELNRHFAVTLLSEKPDTDFGGDSDEFDFKHQSIPLTVLFGGRLEWQSGVLRYLIRYRPKYIIGYGAVRNLKFWIVLFVSRFLGIRFFVHTHGPYKFSTPSFVQKTMYRIITTWSSGMIMYAPICATAIKRILPKRWHKKIYIAENSLSIDRTEVAGTKSDPGGILFVGRLRERCGIELLLEAFELLNSNNAGLSLHIVGDGIEAAALNGLESRHVYHYGAVYDYGRLKEIALKCEIAVYPGDAGLSVLQYFALGLPVVIHDDIRAHMGPEPSYVEFGVNGLAFRRNDVQSLMNAMLRLLSNQQLRSSMSMAMETTYLNLTQPSLAERIVRIITVESRNDYEGS